MNQQAAQAAAMLWQHWRDRTRLTELPAECRPVTRSDGYAIQAEVARLSGQRPVGWKIAATSEAGQRHINASGPFAGRLLSGRQRPVGAPIDLTGNGMRVAEAEFAFTMATALPRRPVPYTVAEVVGAVASLHLAIEVPDSRYVDFVSVGTPQLIADTACACWFLVGDAVTDDWRSRDLASHRVTASRNGVLAAEGAGINVLGDPRVALSWIAHELMTVGEQLRIGDVVITGTCVPPVAVAPGDRVRMDFGPLGAIEAHFE